MKNLLRQVEAYSVQSGSDPRVAEIFTEITKQLEALKKHLTKEPSGGSPKKKTAA